MSDDESEFSGEEVEEEEVTDLSNRCVQRTRLITTCND